MTALTHGVSFEPGAGSDLAGLQTKATRDGDEWVITGQKVWTSEGQHADYGMLIARTEPDAPKHRGISWFAFPMNQQGVEIRPLKEMTGRSLFNEVFIDEARVSQDDLIGEQRGLAGCQHHSYGGASGDRRGHGMACGSSPGSIAGHLDSRPDLSSESALYCSGGVGPGTLQLLRDLAEERDKLNDPRIRQELVRLHTELELMRMNGQRTRNKNQQTGGEGNLAKILMTSALHRTRQLAGSILGPEMALWGEEAATGGVIQEMAVFSPAPSIYGGTDEVQRNIIGERVLGLPKEPGPNKETPFSELLQNKTDW